MVCEPPLGGTTGSDRRRQDVTRVPGRTGVCVVAKGYTYQCTGYMVRVLQMARTLHHLGLSVCIVWLLPVKQFLHRWRLGRAHLAPFDVHFVPILPCFGIRALERLHNWLAAKWIDLLCRRHGAEIVQIEGTEAMQFVAPASLPRVLDVHGDMVAEKNPDVLREADLRATAHLRQEQGAIRAADRILCISRAMRDVLRARHGGIPPAYIVPCLVEVHKFGPAFATRESRRAEFGLRDRLVLCYAGSLFRWQCIEETLRLIIKLRRIDTRYFALFITPGDLCLMRVCCNKSADTTTISAYWVFPPTKCLRCCAWRMPASYRAPNCPRTASAHLRNLASTLPPGCRWSLRNTRAMHRPS